MSVLWLQLTSCALNSWNHKSCDRHCVWSLLMAVIPNNASSLTMEFPGTQIWAIALHWCQRKETSGAHMIVSGKFLWEDGASDYVKNILWRDLCVAGKLYFVGRYAHENHLIVPWHQTDHSVQIVHLRWKVYTECWSRMMGLALGIYTWTHSWTGRYQGPSYYSLLESSDVTTT